MLVVEDEPMLRELLAMDLRDAGAGVSLARDGEEAIAAMDREQPDILLLDLLMPKKDGYAVLQYARQQGYAFPIVVLSNLNSPEEEAKCLTLGAQAFFVKSDLGTGDIWGKIARYLQ